MKKTRLIALGLVLVLSLVSPIVPLPTRASPEANMWTRYPIPETGDAGGWVLTSDNATEETAVTAICVAADGTVYAGVEATVGSALKGYNLFKSTDGGHSWRPLWQIPDSDKPSGGPDSDPKSKIIALVLPRWEYADILYLATPYNIYKATDGGKNFTTLGNRPCYSMGSAATSSRLITSLDVTYYQGSYLAMVGSSDNDTADYGGGYLYDESWRLPRWTDLYVGGGAGTKYDVLDIAFSLDFADDRQIIALVTDETSTIITTRIAGADWGTTVGDATLGFASTSGSLAFPTDYDSDLSEDKYIHYAGLNASDNSSVYIVMGAEAPQSSMVQAMFTPSAATAINSLVAVGEASTETIDPTEAFPAQIVAGLTNGRTIPTGKPPSVPTASNAVVALGGTLASGLMVYAGTSGPGSAFARSIDSGVSFTQTAFIFDNLLTITDLAESLNYRRDSTMYMITKGHSGNEKLWRTTDGGKTWEAVLTATQVITLPSGSTKTVGTFDRVAISLNFAIDTTVFICESQNNIIWRSTDNGFNFAPLLRQPGTTGTINAWLVVESRKILVGDSLGNFYKTTNNGKNWSTAVVTGLSGFSSMALSPDYDNDHTILAGDNNGKVYISTDDGGDWQALTDVDTDLDSGTLVAFSTNYANDKTVYATDNTTDNGILRFVRGTSTQWTRTDQTNPDRIEEVTQNISGLQAADDGNGLSTLYATQSAPVVTRVIGTTAAEGGMARCLNPTGTLSSTTEAPLFETVNTRLPASATMNGLWLAEDNGSTRLWSCDVAATPDVLYTYYDTLTRPLELILPKDGTSSGRQTSAKVSWNGISSATSYEIWYDRAPGFEHSPTQIYSQAAGTNIAPAGGLESGVTYYWRVRVGQSGSSTSEPGTTITFGAPALSRFSGTWAFTTALGGGQWSPLDQPPIVAPSAGKVNVPIKPAFQWNAADRATGYEFTLARDSEFTDVVATMTGANALPATAWACDMEMDYSTTYFWRVRAISSTSQSEWAVSIFTTEPPPSPLPSPPPPSPLPSPPPAPQPETPLYIWVMISTSSVLLIVVLVLIVTTKSGAQ